MTRGEYTEEKADRHGRVVAAKQVTATLRDVSPAFLADGWSFTLATVKGRMAFVRLTDTPSQALVPWMLRRRLEDDMQARLPSLRALSSSMAEKSTPHDVVRHPDDRIDEPGPGGLDSWTPDRNRLHWAGTAQRPAAQISDSGGQS
jgi:hypothetical protein